MKKQIKKILVGKRRLYRIIFQLMADKICERMKHVKTQSEFDYLLGIALQIEFISYTTFSIRLK